MTSGNNAWMIVWYLTNTKIWLFRPCTLKMYRSWRSCAKWMFVFAVWSSLNQLSVGSWTVLIFKQAVCHIGGPQRVERWNCHRSSLPKTLVTEPQQPVNTYLALLALAQPTASTETVTMQKTRKKSLSASFFLPQPSDEVLNINSRNFVEVENETWMPVGC